jgi:hypothetical protein
VKLARRFYAVGLPVIALAHFLNAREATEYVPVWLRRRIGWVYLTGAGHTAAGLAILFGVLPELAALVEAGQITAIVATATGRGRASVLRRCESKNTDSASRLSRRPY